MSTSSSGELRGDPGHRRVRSGDSLERDLGIGSLERVELLVRLEQVFGVRLGDAAMLEADTPADLVGAITAAHPIVVEAMPPGDAGSGCDDDGADVRDDSD